MSGVWVVRVLRARLPLVPLIAFAACLLCGCPAAA